MQTDATALVVSDERRQLRERVKRIVAAARQGPCADCGRLYPPAATTFHHVDPASKRYRPAGAMTPADAIAELAKCIRLCCNCHALRHAEATSHAPGVFKEGCRHGPVAGGES